MERQCVPALSVPASLLEAKPERSLTQSHKAWKSLPIPSASSGIEGAGEGLEPHLVESGPGTEELKRKGNTGKQVSSLLTGEHVIESRH